MHNKLPIVMKTNNPAHRQSQGEEVNCICIDSMSEASSLHKFAQVTCELYCLYGIAVFCCH